MSKIFITALPNKSKPFDEFNLPEKIIIFSFLGNLFNLLIAGYKISQLFLYWNGRFSKKAKSGWALLNKIFNKLCVG